MRLILSKTLLIAALSAATTLAANASPISGALSVADSNGSYTYGTPSGTLNYGASGAITGIGNAGGATSNTFSAYFTNFNAVGFTTTPMAFSAAGGTTIYAPGTVLFSTTENGETLTFYVTSETTVIGSNQSAISLTGTGYFTELCATTCTGAEQNYTQTDAIFTTTGSVSNTTFQIGGTAQTPPVTPEPSSLVLLGTGIIGLAGAVRRKLVKA